MATLHCLARLTYASTTARLLLAGYPYTQEQLNRMQAAFQDQGQLRVLRGYLTGRGQGLVYLLGLYLDLLDLQQMAAELNRQQAGAGTPKTPTACSPRPLSPKVSMTLGKSCRARCIEEITVDTTTTTTSFKDGGNGKTTPRMPPKKASFVLSGTPRATLSHLTVVTSSNNSPASGDAKRGDEVSTASKSSQVRQAGRRMHQHYR